MSTIVLGPWVEQWLSEPRFGVYLTAATASRSLAMELYEWNTSMSAAVLHDLSHLEIGVRNAYDAALTNHALPGSPHWTRDSQRYFPVVLKRAANGRLVDANLRPRHQIEAALRAVGPSAPSDKVVAELMFGFWRYLSTSAHEVSLWRPYLYRGFVPGTSRKAVDLPMSRLHRLRNRAAHHEPLLRQNLAQGHLDVIDLAAFISPQLSAYIHTHSSWTALLQQRPTTP